MVWNELRPDCGHIALWSQYLTAFAPGATLIFNAGVAAGAVTALDATVAWGAMEPHAPSARKKMQTAQVVLEDRLVYGG